MNPNSTVLALDVGGKRIGVAIATMGARLATPLATLDNSPTIYDQIKTLVEQCLAVAVVVGLPRGLDSQETEQTTDVRAFADTLKRALTVTVYLQDEAGTSKQAEEELIQRREPYSKADIDSLAATFILDDFLHNMEL